MIESQLKYLNKRTYNRTWNSKEIVNSDHVFNTVFLRRFSLSYVLDLLRHRL